MIKSDLHKKLGQLMVFGFHGTEVTPEIRTLIHKHHIGGIILFGRNIGTPEEVLKLTTQLQHEAKLAGHKHPLLICIDQENGSVRRLGEEATVLPGSMLLGATGESENAFQTGYMTGRELKALGINWNLAPVLDINNNPENPVIGVRSFGETPEFVSAFGRQMMKGMQAAGILTTLKHFPGYGDTKLDPHLNLPTIEHDFSRLKEVELKPFVDCIQEKADVIMSAHVYFPALEPEKNLPATLSKSVITGLLRETLGFKGVVTTDCLEMDAIRETIGTSKGGVYALKAGADLIMVSHTHTVQHETLSEIEKALQTEELTIDMIDEAYKRIMTLKEKYLSWDEIPFDKDLKVADEFGHHTHKKKALQIYRQGITITKNEESVLPLQLHENDRLLIVYPENKYATLIEDQRYASISLGETIKKLHGHTRIEQLASEPTAEEIQKIAQMASHFDYVIVGTLSVTREDKQVKLVEAIVKQNQHVIVVAMRNPYDISYLPEDILAYICTYEFTKPALTIAAKAIFGEVEVTGKLPVTVM